MNLSCNYRLWNLSEPAILKMNYKQDTINVFVELRDVNYPGSQYNLQYDPKADRMKGTYYQAFHDETYDIEFVRVQ